MKSTYLAKRVTRKRCKLRLYLKKQLNTSVFLTKFSAEGSGLSPRRDGCLKQVFTIIKHFARRTRQPKAECTCLAFWYIIGQSTYKSLGILFRNSPHSFLAGIFTIFAMFLTLSYDLKCCLFVGAFFESCQNQVIFYK